MGSMQSGQGRIPYSSCALLLHRACSGLSMLASPSARFISILSSPRSRAPLHVLAIHSQDPDFYKIPYVEGIPVGKRLKLWNLPPNCKHSELLEWFAGIDVTVESLEFTDDPALNAQGIGGFVEFATKQHACIAIVRLDGCKFRGHYIRLDFAEKRPHSRDYGSRRNRSNRSSSSSSRGSFATSSSRPSVTDMVPSYDGTTSANAQFTSRYEAASSSAVPASSGFGSRTLSANTQSNPRHEAAKFSAAQASSDYGSTQSSDFYRRNSAAKNEGIQSNSSYGNTQSPSGVGYGNTQSRPGYGKAASSSMSGGNLSVSSTTSAPNSQSAPKYGISPENGVDSQSVSSYVQSNATFIQSSVGSLQMPFKSSGPESSPGSVSIAPQPSHNEAQTFARSSATQAASRTYDGTETNPIGTVSNNGLVSLQSPVAQGPPPRPLNSSSDKVVPYEDAFNNYGVPDAAVVEPWSWNASFRSGPMFGSPQPASLNRLFVSNLHVSIDDAALQELFSKFGTVLEARVLRDQESGRSRGFAVVAMSSVDETKAASNALSGWRVESCPLKVDAVTFKH